MTQISGSISLEVSKLVRETTRATLEALLRDPEEDPREQEAPMEVISRKISELVLARLNYELGGVLREIRESLARIEQATGAGPESLVVRGPDGSERYRLPDGPYVDVEASEAGARADARLAEAQREGPADSWYEEAAP